MFANGCGFGNGRGGLYVGEVAFYGMMKFGNANAQLTVDESPDWLMMMGHLC